MINSILLQNFQNHLATAVDLDEFVTTLIGGNSAGKTAVLRGFRFLCFNKPRGDSFVRRGSERCHVEADFDGVVVSRVKGKKENLYQLNGDLKAFKSEIPADVAKLVNLGDVNFQTQDDPYFWFKLPPGQVAKQLNEVVDLSLIDASLSHAASVVRKEKSTVEVCRTRLKQAREKRDGLAWVKDAEAVVNKLETLQNRYETKLATTNEAETALKRLQAAVERRETVLRRLQSRDLALRRGAAYVKVSRRLAKAEGLLRKVKELQAIVDRPKLDLHRLTEAKAELETVGGRLSEAESLLRSLKTEQERSWLAKKSLGETRAELERKFGGRCPLCGAANGRPS